jgi:hypothetical protein
MLITCSVHAASPSTRLPLSALNTGSQLGVSIEGGGRGTSGTTLPTYDVRVPAFLKGDAFPGVRAWSPPV